MVESKAWGGLKSRVTLVPRPTLRSINVATPTPGADTRHGDGPRAACEDVEAQAELRGGPQARAPVVEAGAGCSEGTQEVRYSSLDASPPLLTLGVRADSSMRRMWTQAASRGRTRSR